MLRIKVVAVATITAILPGFTAPAMAVEGTIGGYASYSWWRLTYPSLYTVYDAGHVEYCVSFYSTLHTPYHISR